MKEYTVNPESLDPSFLIQFVRNNSLFDADLLQTIIDEWKAYRATGISASEVQKISDMLSEISVDIPKEVSGWIERCTWHVRKCDELLHENEVLKKSSAQVIHNKPGVTPTQVEVIMEDGCLWDILVSRGACVEVDVINIDTDAEDRFKLMAARDEACADNSLVSYNGKSCIWERSQNTAVKPSDEPEQGTGQAPLEIKIIVDGGIVRDVYKNRPDNVSVQILDLDTDAPEEGGRIGDYCDEISRDPTYIPCI